MTRLPASWSQAQIGDICVITQQVEPEPDQRFRYIDISAVDRETKAIVGAQEVLGRNAPSRARKLVQTGDTLVSMTRPNLNAVALVKEELDGQIASTGFEVLRAPGMDPRWLAYLVRSRAFVDSMTSLVQGALYPAVRSKDVRGFVAPIAPAGEQQRIADKLDTVLARVDACRDRLANVAPLIKRFRQSALAAATSGRLTASWRTDRGLTTPWKRLSIGRVATKVTDGEHSTPRRSPSGKLLLSARNVQDGRIALESVDYVDSDEFARIRKRCDPQIGDVLLSCSGSVGRSAIVDADDSYVMVRSVALIRPNRDLCAPKYLMYCLQSPDLQEQIDASSKSTAQANIFLGPIKALELPLPDLEEQAEIVRRIDALFSLASGVEARLAQAQATTNRLTPALLAKAFRGELAPQDPNDEPADELLRQLALQKKHAKAKPRPRAT